MKRYPLASIAFLLALISGSAFTNLFADGNPAVFDRKNIAAWCIVPFDSAKRDPEQRAEMVQKVGIAKVAYDWRPEHVPQRESATRGVKFVSFANAGRDEPTALVREEPPTE